MATFTIAGTEVVFPTDIDVSFVDKKKTTFAASGKMNVDIIAQKRVVSAVWAVLRDNELKTITNVINANKPFFDLTFPDVGGETTIRCCPSDIKASLGYVIDGERHWENINIEFTEQ